jgi:GIY-YIG catalytic domain
MWSSSWRKRSVRWRRAEVAEPLQGLTMGERLAWYGEHMESAPGLFTPPPELGDLIESLGMDTHAQAPSEFLATNGNSTRAPGLYSWWVDQAGAADLTEGLGHDVAPGLIYAGLAGATRSRSGRQSKNTVWGRIRGMHLGGRHEFPTFRLSLGSILASARAEAEINEDRLTEWMHEHLRLVALAVEDADALDGLETAVLADLNPPLNLDKMPPSPVRNRLTELRRQYSRTSRSRRGEGLTGS